MSASSSEEVRTLRLGQRIILTTTTIVVLMGLLTVGILHGIISNALDTQLAEKGLATSRVLADDLANPLLDGDTLVVQRALQRFLGEGSSVVYAYVIVPDPPQVIHTFAGGFPLALLEATRLAPDESSSVERLATEQGRVRDFGIRVLRGLDYEVHVGYSEESILVSSRRVTWLVAGLTALGVLAATLLAWLLGRYVAKPLERFAANAEAVGEGRLDSEIRVSGHDEISALADSFNRMVRRLRDAMGRERRRNRELTALNAVATTISVSEDLCQGMTTALGEVVEVLGLKGAWVVITADDEGDAVTHEAFADLNRAIFDACVARWGSFLGPGHRRVGPFPLVSGGRDLGLLHAVLPDQEDLAPEDHEILTAVARQLGVGLERSLLWQRLRDREERVSQLLQKVIDAQEDERLRIARELHDETSQSMAALTVGLKAAASLVERNPKRAETILEGLKEATAQTLREIHNIVYDLRPTLLDDMGLVPALQWCAARWLSDQGIEVTVGTGGVNRRLPQRVETTLYRIGQEAITNVSRHSGARHLNIHVQWEQAQVVLSVVDDGRGFDPHAAGRDGRDNQHLGLVGMAERAGLLGGECRVNSVPGEGTRVDVVIPLEEGGGTIDPAAAGR